MLAVVSGCQSPLLSTLLSDIAFSATVEMNRIRGGIQHGTTDAGTYSARFIRRSRAVKRDSLLTSASH